MSFNKDLLDELLKNYKKPEDIIGENGLLKQLSKAILEKALEGELTHHLGYEKHSKEGSKKTNSRNGKTNKTLIIKIKDNGHIKNKALNLIVGINLQGQKEILGLWIAQNEGAKFWLSIVTELKNRGVQDILIACIDGLKGFPEAINSVYPQTQ